MHCLRVDYLRMGTRTTAPKTIYQKENSAFLESKPTLQFGTPGLFAHLLLQLAFMSAKSLGLPYVLRARASTSRPDDLLMAVSELLSRMSERGCRPPGCKSCLPTRKKEVEFGSGC